MAEPQFPRGDGKDFHVLENLPRAAIQPGEALAGGPVVGAQTVFSFILFEGFEHFIQLLLQGFAFGFCFLFPAGRLFPGTVDAALRSFGLTGHPGHILLEKLDALLEFFGFGEGRPMPIGGATAAGCQDEDEQEAAAQSVHTLRPIVKGI